MFCLFPVMGIVQGFIPIAGYNYGANKIDRVRESINTAIKYAAIVSCFIFVMIMAGANPMIAIFSKELALINSAPNALRIVFLVTPLIAIQLIGSAYFQAVGKVAPALVLTLSKQGLFLIPLVILMPRFFGIDGVWYSFPVADLMSTLITWIVLKREINNNLQKNVTPI